MADNYCENSSFIAVPADKLKQAQKIIDQTEAYLETDGRFVLSAWSGFGATTHGSPGGSCGPTPRMQAIAALAAIACIHLLGF